jgi:putative membrane-bound dehydrogenase-like protein
VHHSSAKPQVTPDPPCPPLSRGGEKWIRWFPTNWGGSHSRSLFPNPQRTFALLASSLCWLLFATIASAAEPGTTSYRVGVAKIDITPAYPIRLSGFGSRRTESEGVAQRIWAKALAIDNGQPALLITVDNVGVPAALVTELRQRLHKKAGLDPERLAVTATHTHTAPMLKGMLSTLFGMPIPKEHQERIDRYTAEFLDKLETVALAALADRQSAYLSWGIGRVGFATNRRTKGGPVDHDMPLLVVRDSNRKIRAVYVNYACHCVTLSFNKISGDWAGFAQELLQQEYPGAIALVSIGCGADSNPSSRGTGDKVEVAARQGAEIAGEVKRLLAGYLAPVTGPLRIGSLATELPLAALPTEAEWAERGQRKDAVGYHARVQLERLKQGQKLPTAVPYAVQTWRFGDSLAMAFLPGEVVVDYSLRLKAELDGLRVWLNAYSNDSPAYIPSERILKEGGYEGGGAMVYYDVPVPFRPGLENKIIGLVEDQLRKGFVSPFRPTGTHGSRPQSPQQALATLKTQPGFAVDLMAAEPLVVDPVAISFGPDGRLWVAEMVDYPAGKRGDFRPGGRIRVLEDTDGDGFYDKSTVFLDNIPFPTGVTAWRQGVLICSAPDILYAEDTKRDGKADLVRKLFSGFGVDNYQARVNSLEYGLDGWVYGSCGLFGGRIKRFTGAVVDLGNRDFRIQPDTGLLEPATGRTQQGRVRNDWDDWFGCDNSNLCWHYPLADHELRRNPFVAPPAAGVLTSRLPNPNQLFPLQKQLQLFALSGPPGQATAACGIGVYRDILLGQTYSGNAFTCEPVNLCVTRQLLEPLDSTFAGHRASEETASEFLASTDNWFRPVQARTGPDGALWIVDMYRYVIEHPRWIPAEERAQLDVRAGDTLGRIYRVRPTTGARPMQRLDRLDTGGLVAALDSPNGWQRDMAAQMLLWRCDKAAAPLLEQMVEHSARPETRMQALCVLDVLGSLPLPLVRAALSDKHPGVRRHAVRLAGKSLGADGQLGPAIAALGADPDGQVRLQVVYALGAWHDKRAGQALVAVALRYPDDPYLIAAMLSSVDARNIDVTVAAALEHPVDDKNYQDLVGHLLGLAGSMSSPDDLSRILSEALAGKERFTGWHAAGLAGVLDALERRGLSWQKLPASTGLEHIRLILTQARRELANEQASLETRLLAVPLLAREPGRLEADFDILGKLLSPNQPLPLQTAALAHLGAMSNERVANIILANWKSFTPSLRSQALDLLLGRDAWRRQLLEAIDKKQVLVADVDAKRRQHLLEQKDENLRSLAAKLFTGATRADRQKVLDEHAAVLTMTADATRGHAVFARRCATCHRLGNTGFAVGPDLASVSTKTPAYLLTEILDPNRNVDIRFHEYVAVTKSGRIVTGILSSESAASVTFRNQDGKEQTLLRSELEDLKSSGKSLMPEGLEKDLSRQDLADVILFLKSPGQAK